MAVIHSTIACNLDSNLLLAALPLFEAEKVQAIEWSFDALRRHSPTPDWFTELIQTYSQENRLIGHGVYFSLFSGRWTKDQSDWLAQLKSLSADYTFNHITEHFGFTTGEDFHKGAPVSPPFTASVLALGRDRLKRIQTACSCPVGLENLALAYSLDDVKRQGDFLNQLIEPVNGFIILDLHNLFCQSHNFGLAFPDLLRLYPLDRVREIHISGGSWASLPSDSAQIIRRDTHDDSVPDKVFDYLDKTISQCPNLCFVVLEQIGSGLATEESRALFQRDFLRMDDIVGRYAHSQPCSNSFERLHSTDLVFPPLEDSFLYAQQMELSTILETAADYQQAQQLLYASSLANSGWEVEKWAPSMLETALSIAQKWKNGFSPAR